MYRHRLILLGALLTAGGACNVPQTDDAAASRPTLANDYVVRRPRTNDGIGALAQAVTVGDGTNGAHIVYFNFDGATVTHSNWGDDPASNSSTIPTTTRTIPAFNSTPYAPTYTRQTAIDEIVNKYKQFYAPYNVQVTTTRPAAGVRYTMALVGGTPQDLHGNIGPTSEAGISPMDCGNMEETNISFVFSAVLEPNTTGRSKTDALDSVALDIAHETGHSFGLEHTTNNTDIMFPSIEDSQTAFQGTSQLADGPSSCGGGSTQDSNQRLLDNIGPSSAGGGGGPVTNNKPKVAFATPKNGSTVPRQFTITALAQPQTGTLTDFEVTIGSQVLMQGTTPSLSNMYQFDQDGPVTMRATATDSTGGVTSVQLNFTISSSAPPQDTNCTTDSDCNTGLVCNLTSMQCDWTSGGTMPGGGGGSGPGVGGQSCSTTIPCPAGQTCNNGMCVSDQPGGNTMPQPGDLGASCQTQSECMSGLCGRLDGQSFCTKPCSVNDPTSCPSTMECTAAGSDAYCTPKAGGGGGASSCSVAGSGESSASLAVLLLFALAVVRRRYLVA
jgi:MYXO-CTERM domain-containing protein